MVQLPAPATGGQARAATHVPASDKWLALGAGTPDQRGRKAGGLKHYGGGLFHIDTGPRRRW